VAAIKIGAGVTAGIISLMTMTAGMPLLVMAGIIGLDDPLGGGGGLNTDGSPPTARPGTSNHEQGLAIDFDRRSSRGAAFSQWLASHAPEFGIYNLRSEP